MFKALLLSSLLSSMVMAQDQQVEPISPEIIEQQLQDAEKEFNEAKKMFNPWYAGPLLAPSAHILPPGNYNIQPYLFYTNIYGNYDKHGVSHSRKHNTKQLNPSVIFQWGMLDWFDGVINVQTISNWSNGKSSTHFGDTSLSFGFGIQKETVYKPAILIGVKENFPSGKYSSLSSSLGGIDATGAGAYSTTLSLNLSKVIWWWWPLHPINFRGSFQYTFPSIAKVNGFHAYGGGYGTKGKIHTPNAFMMDLAFEFSFTQRWVFCTDFVYDYSAKTKFVGKKGVDSTGLVAVNGAPFSEQISLAPGIEYNPNENIGILGGVWFTVWGENSSEFVSGILSVTASF